MEIKKYVPEKHAEYLPDYQKEGYTDGDIEKFKSVARKALEELREVVDLETEGLELVLGLTDPESMDEDAPEDFYFMGFSFYEGLRDYPGYAVFMRVTDEVSNWEARMKDMLVHELGHQVIYQKGVGWPEDSYNQYYSILFEGHAENLARIVAEQNGRSYTPIWRQNELLDIDRDKLKEDLEHRRTFGDDEDEVNHNMFINGGDRWPNAEGYTIAYQIVRHMIEEDKVSIQSVIKVPRAEWIEMVDDAVEELY